MPPILLAALLLLLPLFFLLQRKKRKSIIKTTSLTPPCPPKLPFIGNLHQLSSIPHRSLWELSKKHGPLMLLQLGSVPTLVVSSPSYAEEILKFHDIVFASRPSLKVARILLSDYNDMAFAPYGELWREMRKVSATHLLSAKMVQSFSQTRMDEVSLTIDKITNLASTNNGVVCMSEIFSSLTNDMLCKCVLGSSMSEEKRKLLCDLIRKNMIFLGEVLFVEDFFPKFKWLDVILGLEGKVRRHFEDWDALLEEFIEEHGSRLKEGDSRNSTNFIDVMLQIQKDSSLKFDLTKGHIKAILMDMIVAGTDTSFVLLEWSMAELIRNPEVMKKLRKEIREIAHGEVLVKEEHLVKMKYLKAFIKEVLRLHPPIPLLLPRESSQECEIQGYTIPKGTRVLVNAWAIGRDASFWEDPHELKPERFMDCSVDYKGNDFQYIPFGGGRRICPGVQFATVFNELALANLLYRFDWKLPNGISPEDMNLEDGNGLIATVKEKLDLVPVAVSVGN